MRNSIGYPPLNVKIGATHAGISVGEDGATHQCLEDLALMRAIPGMVVLNPADDVEARAAVHAAYDHVGPVYLRFGRLAVPVLASAAKTGKVVTIEEHSVIGGLGSAVCDILSEKQPTKVMKIGINDVFGESGPALELIQKYGLDAQSIYEKVKAFVKQN